MSCCAFSTGLHTRARVLALQCNLYSRCIHSTQGSGCTVDVLPLYCRCTAVVPQALRALDKVFGSTVNAKGYKVIQGAGVIQGDGINVATIGAILAAVVGEGFSAENVAFGMGGGLLQRVNRCVLTFGWLHVDYSNVMC